MAKKNSNLPFIGMVLLFGYLLVRFAPNLFPKSMVGERGYE